MNQTEFPRRRLSPQINHPTTTADMMGLVMVALVPALAMAVFFFGPRVLVLTAVSMASAVGFEALYRRLTHQEQTISDLSAAVTGLLLAMCLPADAPYWLPVLGTAFGIIVVKQFYGGLGKNFMNPALAGRMLLATFPMLMTTWSAPLDRLPLFHVDALTSSTPMSFLHEGTLPPQGIGELLLGQQGGCLGEVSAFMLLLGGGYLMLRKVISPRIPLSFLGTVALVALLTPGPEAGRFSWMAAQLCSGGLMLGAFFLAPDPATSPITPRGQFFYGCGCGLLTMLLRYHSSYPEGVGWAILTMNCCVWLLDRAGSPRRYGMSRFGATAALLRRIRTSVARIKFQKPVFRHRAQGQVPGEGHLDYIRVQTRSMAALAAVILVTGVMVYAVHRQTEFAAAETQARRQMALIDQVMPQAETASQTPYRANGALDISAGYDADNKLVGYGVKVQSQGFGGIITMVVGVDLDGKVTGLAVLDHREDVRVGGMAVTPAALQRYVGRSGTLRTDGGWNSVDTVSGATATSKALTAGVNRALSIVANLDTKGVEPNEDDTL